MPESSHVVRTEVRGLDVCLGDSVLAITREGEPVIPPILLSAEDAERLRMEMAKAQLWEWNRIEELKTNAARRYKHYLASWLVLCLAAFSAFVGFPSFYLPVFLTLLSLVIWWRAGFAERQTDRAAREERNRFVPDWSYFRQRLEESESPPSTSS